MTSLLSAIRSSVPRYKLLRKVGSGAYGFVVAAEDVVPA